MEQAKQPGKSLTLSYSISQCISVMGYSSIFSFAAVFLLARGFTNSQIGLTLTIANGLSLLTQPFVANFADKSKKITLRKIAGMMLAGMALISSLLLITPALVLPVSLLYILLVTFFATQIPLVTSMAMEHINNGSPINFSLARGIGSLAYAVLSICLGFMVDQFGVWVILAVNIGIGIFGFIQVSTFKKPIKRMTAPLDADGQSSGLIEFGLKNKRFMGVIASIALLFLSHVLINTYTIQIMNNVGGDSSDLGIAIAIAAFLELPAMALFPSIFKKLPDAGKIMKISGAFFVIKATITLLAPSVLWIYLAQCLQFFGYAFFTPASVYYVNQVIKDADKVKGQTFMGMAFGISNLIGNFFGGLMLDASGSVTFMLTVGTVISIVGLIALLWIDNFHARQAKNQPSSLVETP